MWVFVLLLNLTSFGGDVTVTVRAVDESSCVRLRKMILEQLGGERNLKGTATPCSLTQ